MIVIIGAGISGLTLAYELQKKGIKYSLLENSSEAGGYIKTVNKSDYLLELGPNTILADAKVKAFLYELGLNDQMLIPKNKSKKRYVLKHGKLKMLPSGPVSFLFGNFFSWETKKAIFRERNLKNEGKEEETIGEFFERRFNKELVDYAVDPFVSGIFAGDPYKLLISKTFPFLKKMEQEYGSVVKGFMNSKSSPKKDTIIFKNGMNEMVTALADNLDHLVFNTRVTDIKKMDNKILVSTLQDQTSSVIEADKVVFTTPSFAMAKIMKGYNPVYADQLNTIGYAPMIKVFMGYKKRDVEIYPNGYGVLNPSCEKQFTLGTIWNTSINEQSSLSSNVLFTVMIGGDSKDDCLQLSDQELVDKVHNELKTIYNISASPDFFYVYKIPKAIPQYNSKMLGIEQIADQLMDDGIYIAANWYKGAGVSDCIKKSIDLSEKINSLSVRSYLDYI